MIVFGGTLATWEEELTIGWVKATGGIGGDVRQVLFIEQEV